MTRLHLGKQPKMYKSLKSAGRAIAEFAFVFRSLDYHVEGLRKAEKERSNSVPAFDSQKRIDFHLKTIFSRASFRQICDLTKQDFSESVKDRLVTELQKRYDARLESTITQLAHSASRMMYISFAQIPIEVRAALNGSNNNLTSLSYNYSLVEEINSMKSAVEKLIASGKLSTANSKTLTEMLAKPPSFYAAVLSNWVATTPYGNSA